MRFFLKFFDPFHTFVFRLSGGRLLGTLIGFPVLLLTTTGRRSGKRRTSPLLYLEEEESLLVVGSMAGAPRHPDWYHNLVANPMVEVETRAGRRPMRAEPSTEEERRRRYERFKAGADRYATYETRTDRAIPVVVLREVDG